MKVKGTAVRVTPLFIRDRFGQEGLDSWLAALPCESKAIFGGTILTNAWYPMDDAFVLPHRILVNQFFKGDPMGLWKLGRYAADQSLRGVYKIFVRMGSPGFLIKKTSRVFQTFYEPGQAVVAEEAKDGAKMHILGFPEVTGLVETRIAGWIERALEISGCRDVSVAITKSFARGDDRTEISARWKA